MDLGLFPNEIIKIIISKLLKRDAKNVALTSKKMYYLALERIWSKPILKDAKNLDFLKQISHLPIHDISTSIVMFFIGGCSYAQVLKYLPQLKALRIYHDGFKSDINVLDLRQTQAAVTLHTTALPWKLMDTILISSLNLSNLTK